MAVVGINYKGRKKKLKYQEITVSYSNLEKNKVFNSGDFIKDWYQCNKFLMNEVVDKEPICNSSSVDHFIMDGAPYQSAYLHFINEVPVLLYWDDKIHNFYDHSYIFDKGIENFVKEGEQPSWEEFKKYCNETDK